MKIVRHPYLEDIVSHQRIYGSDRGEMYFAFNCDENGVIEETKLHEAAVENYKACVAGTKFINDVKMVFIEVKTTNGTVRHEGIGLCDDCGAKVYLTDSLTNTCDCGAEYNMSGQRLRPRSEWEEPMDDDY